MGGQLCFKRPGADFVPRQRSGIDSVGVRGCVGGKKLSR
jgi:hypothetical protein